MYLIIKLMNNNEKYFPSYGCQQGLPTTINPAAQQQNIRQNHQYYGFTANVIVRQNEKAMAYFVSPLSLSLWPPLPPSLSLSLSLSLYTHTYGWVGR